MQVVIRLDVVRIGCASRYDVALNFFEQRYLDVFGYTCDLGSRSSGICTADVPVYVINRMEKLCARFGVEDVGRVIICVGKDYRWIEESMLIKRLVQRVRYLKVGY